LNLKELKRSLVIIENESPPRSQLIPFITGKEKEICLLKEKAFEKIIVFK